MAFLVEITPIAESQIEQAYQWYRDRNPEFADRWFRGMMNAIATLQKNPVAVVWQLKAKSFQKKSVNSCTAKPKTFIEFCLRFEKVQFMCCTYAIFSRLR
jgi:arginyl-tRNA synthetase